jgi:hypothetical protein
MMSTIITNALQLVGMVMGALAILLAAGAFAACGLSGRISREEEAEDIRLWIANHAKVRHLHVVQDDDVPDELHRVSAA